METSDKYIPREYLALKINYCRQQLNLLPNVRLHDHRLEGTVRKRVIVDNHKYLINTPEGEQYYKIWIKRNELERELRIYETIWHNNFIGEPPPGIKPGKVIRLLTTGPDKQILMDKAFFDSLKNDDNVKHPKYKHYFFNGIYYRSASEKDLAIYYTEMGIPFKYEPSIMIYGLPQPVNPDFVLYFRELDNCKIHEHLGMKESSDYLRDTRIKYSNYTNAGLIPEIDILFSHDKDGTPFDIRYMAAKLNSAIYGTITWLGA